MNSAEHDAVQGTTRQAASIRLVMRGPRVGAPSAISDARQGIDLTIVDRRMRSLAMFMSAADYRESLRRHRPRVYLDGDAVESVADEPRLAPGINAVGLTYDYALRTELSQVMTATQRTSGQLVNRMLHVPATSQDLLNKLEAVRVICQETGCAMRYLAGDAFAGILQATHRLDQDKGTDYQ